MELDRPEGMDQRASWMEQEAALASRMNDVW